MGYAMPEKSQNQIEHEEFLKLIGDAIQNWQLVEIELFMIYLVLISPDPFNTVNLKAPHVATAAASYHAVINFKTACDIVDAAARVRLDNSADIFKEWSNLLSKIGGQARIRNKLVHWMLSVDLYSNGILKFKLAQNPWNPLTDNNDFYSKKQVKQFSKDFFEVGQLMGKFKEGVLQFLYGTSEEKAREQYWGHKTENQNTDAPTSAE
jgi:hypothetical protein